jgi:2-polyprenyl-6-methoxyphenol hydroxylase-like FAD-dependent oxidoreductase
MNVDVIVVGAGPSGALLAYLLAKKNIQVLLLERTNEIAQSFRGEHLNEEGESILRKHGLYEEIEQLGALKMEQLEYWLDGDKIKTIYPSMKVGHLGIHVPQAHLLQVILKHANTCPTFQHCLKSRVSDLIKDENGRIIGVVANRDGETINIYSNLVIGADGRYSTVRKKANMKADIRKHGYDLLWARIPAPPNWDPSIKMALVDDMQISIFTQVNGYVQIGWNIPENSYATLRKQPFQQLIDKLVNAFPELRSSIDQHITNWKDFVVLDVFSSKCDEWVQDGLALIGDAVHTMTPTGAFGLNSAMRDADILASYITKEKLEQLNINKLAQQRKQEINQIQALQIEREATFLQHFEGVLIS